MNTFLQEIGGKDNLASSALYQEYLQGIDLTKFRRTPTPEQLFDGFRGWLPIKKGIISSASKYTPLARQKTVDYLQTCFANVQLKLDQPYPYWTNYRSEHDNFFVAKGPKQKFF